jgi:spore coat protein U-like protein
VKWLRGVCLAVFGLVGLFGSGQAQAHSCTVQATPLVFGGYASPNGPRVDSTATVQVFCTPTYLLLACSVSYTLSLSHGVAGTPGARLMAAGSGQLRYDLYRDAARTLPWGDGGGGGGVVGGSITSGLLGLVCAPGARSHTVYGRIPANQNVPPGVYQDPVVLTITY